MPVVKVDSEASYTQHVKEGLVLVDFYATWCGPCRQIAPAVEDLSAKQEYSKVKFLKVDVDELPEVAEKEEVTSMPTFKLFKDGKVVEVTVGANAQRIEEMLKRNISK